MKVGVVTDYRENLEDTFNWCVENGIPTCQLSVGQGNLTEEVAERIKAAVKKTGMEITATVGNWSGPSAWNFTNGPQTLGIVPREYREMRLKELERCADFAKTLNVPAVCTHFGFIPENPSEPLYAEVVTATRGLAEYYAGRGLRLNMETGQETPVTLLRVINDVGAANLGLNFDPANLLMYGKANPLDALDIVGKYVNGVHVKDGEYPTDGKDLGKEKPLGQGRVNIPAFIRKLKDNGYDGALTIEREIHGERQRIDILAAREMLDNILKEL